jgi:sugar/nucleoside kinase (ribokinase family)
LRILLIGEINLDLILQGCHGYPSPGREVLVDDFAMTLGSSGAISGAGLVRLGDTAAYFGKAGADLAGKFCVERMAALGLGVSRVKLDPSLKTGVTISIASGQERSLVSYLGATQGLTAAEIPDDVFAGFDHLHCSSYFIQTGLHPGFEDIYERASRFGLTTSLDPACDPSGHWQSGLDRVLRYVDVFLPNELELEGITGEKDPASGLRALANGRTLSVAKLGPRGAMALQDGVPVRVEAPAVEAVDVTGAGDCFNAGFLHGWLRKWPIEDALRFAVACGSFSIRGLGGTGAQPTEEQARELLRAWGAGTRATAR